MEEILDNFELGIEVDKAKDFVETSQAIELCTAKLQSLIVTNKLETDENIAPIDASTYDEASCLTSCQEELYSATFYELALRKLFKSQDPQYEEYKKIFRYLFYQLQQNENEAQHLEEELDQLRDKILELKSNLKIKQNELDKTMALKSAANNKDRNTDEKYKKKIQNINNWQSLIREMILLKDESLTDNGDLVELLKKYRKPFKPVM